MVEAIGEALVGTETIISLNDQPATDKAEVKEKKESPKSIPFIKKGPFRNLEVSYALKQGILNRVQRLDPRNSMDSSELPKLIKGLRALKKAKNITASPDLKMIYMNLKQWQSKYSIDSVQYQLAQTLLYLPVLLNQPIHSLEDIQQIVTTYIHEGPGIPENCAPRDLYATFPGITKKDLAGLFQALNLPGQEEEPTTPDVAIAALVQIKDFKGEDEEARQYLIDHICENMIHASLKDRINPKWQEHMMRGGGTSPGLWKQVTAEFNISEKALGVLSQVLHVQGPWPQKPS